MAVRETSGTTSATFGEECLGAAHQRREDVHWCTLHTKWREGTIDSLDEVCTTKVINDLSLAYSVFLMTKMAASLGYQGDWGFSDLKTQEKPWRNLEQAPCSSAPPFLCTMLATVQRPNFTRQSDKLMERKKVMAHKFRREGLLDAGHCGWEVST